MKRFKNGTLLFILLAVVFVPGLTAVDTTESTLITNAALFLPDGTWQAIGGSCAGYVASAPDFRLNYTAGGFSLNVYFESGSDTTLVINDPSGQWYCDDDSRGNLNPAVHFANPASGQYDIWVGSFDASGGAGGTLSISELQ